MKRKKLLDVLLKNWLDVLGIGLFFSCLVIAAFFFLRKASYVTVTLRISETDRLASWSSPEPGWYLEHIQKDMTDKDVFGRVNLKVEKVYYYPNNGSEQTVFIDLVAKSVYNKRSNTYSYNGTQLLVGSHQNFNLNGTQISGVIHDLNHTIVHPSISRKVYGELEVKYNEDAIHLANTEFEGVRKYVSKNIVPGLEVKDSEGKVIAKILEVKKANAYKKFVYKDALVKVLDPDREKIYLVVEVQLSQVHDKYLFKEESPVLINSQIGLDFKDFGIVLTVVDPNYQFES